MRSAKTFFLVAAILVVIASPALAGKVKPKEDGGWIVLLPTLFFLAALPLAVAMRATSAFPGRLADRFREKAFLKRIVGIALLVLMILVASRAGARPRLAAVLLILFCGFLLVSLTAPAQFLGRRLFADAGRGSSVGAFTLGWLLLAGMSLLPLLGLLFMLYHLCWGMGAVVLSLFEGSTGE